jgi:hypothetical protein
MPTRLRILFRACAFVIALFAMHATTVRAQATGTAAAAADTTYEVRLNDGSTVVGRIESRNDSGIVLVTTAGIRMDIPHSSIREIRVAHGRVVDGEYWTADPNKTRLFFAPTARAVGSGQGYVGTYFVLLPFIAFGVGNHLTLAGGAPLLFGQIQPIYIAPKLTFMETPKSALAVGVLSVMGVGDDFIDNFGVAFGMGTFGTVDNAFTAGIGFGYAGDDVAGQPVFMLGGEMRGGRRVKFITENYFVAGETGALVSGGLRIIGDRLSVDVGMGGIFADGDGGCCLPIVNFAYSFGK